MSSGAQYIRGVAAMALGNWAEQVANLAVFMVLLRLLGAESLGVLTMAMAFVLVGEGLVRETVSEVLFSAGDRADRLTDALFWALLPLGSVLSALLIVLSPAIAALYRVPEVAPLLALLAPTVLLTGVTSVPVAILKQRMEIRPLAERAFYGVVLGGVAGIVLALLGAGIWALAAQRLVLTAVNVVWAWRAASWRPGPWPGHAAIARLIPFARNMLAYRLSEMGNMQLPAIAIGVAHGPVSLGYYSIAWRLVELLTFLIVTPIRTAALPTLATERERGRMDRLFADTLRLTGFIAIPAFAGLVVTATEVLHLFGGAEWEPATPILQILAGFGMLLCLSKVEETLLLALGWTRGLARVSLVNLGALTVLLALLWPYGPAAMTASVVLAAAAAEPFRIRLASKATGRPRTAFLRQQVGPLAASLVFALVLVPLGPMLDQLPPLVSLPVAAAIGAAIYIALARWKMYRRLSMAAGYIAALRHGSADPLAHAKGDGR